MGRSPGGGHGNPLQNVGLENSVDCIVHDIAKSQTRLSNFHFLLPPELPGEPCIIRDLLKPNLRIESFSFLDLSLDFTCFIHDSVYMSMLLSQFVLHFPSPAVSADHSQCRGWHLFSVNRFISTVF